MNAKEALIKLENLSVDINEDSSVPYGETIDYQIIYDALHRLEELEKANKSLTKELKKQDKELVGLAQALRIIKEYILKDMAVFTNGEMAYLQFKCDKDLVCYGLPYEKLYEIKEYLL